MALQRIRRGADRPVSSAGAAYGLTSVEPKMFQTDRDSDGTAWEASHRQGRSPLGDRCFLV